MSIFLGLGLSAPVVALITASSVPGSPEAGIVVLSWVPSVSNHVADVVFALAATLCFLLNGHYSPLKPPRERFVDVGVIVGALVLLQFFLVGPGGAAPSLATTAIGWGITSAILMIGRGLVRRVLVERNVWLQPAIVVGPVATARDLAHAIAERPETGLRAAHILGTDEEGILRPIDTVGEVVPTACDSAAAEQPRMPPNDSIATDLAKRFARHAVILCLPSSEADDEIRRLLLVASSVSCHTAIAAPNATGFPMPVSGATPIDETNHLFWVKNRLGCPFRRAAKRVFDVVASFLMLVLLAPLFGLIAFPALIRRKDPFYGHRRVGQFGRSFICYKFQTMVSDSDEVLEHLLATDGEARREWERSFKLRDDPRITPLGAILRRTSLDELPQLWNVLKGDMSLVGPRPVIEHELGRYGDEAMCYCAVRPGLTGLWQVSGRNDTSYDQRVALDLAYLRGWSMWRDIGILLRTVPAMLRGSGAY